MGNVGSCCDFEQPSSKASLIAPAPRKAFNSVSSKPGTLRAHTHDSRMYSCTHAIRARTHAFSTHMHAGSAADIFA